MIKEHNKVFRRVQQVSDLTLVTVSFFIGYFLRDKVFYWKIWGYPDNYLLDSSLAPIGYYVIYIGLLPVLLFIWGVLLNYFGMYKTIGLIQIPDAMLIILKTALIGFVLFGGYVFILKMQQDISRLFIGLTFLLAAILLSIEKIVFAQIFNILSRRDTSFKSALLAFRRVLVIGTNKRAVKFIQLINDNADWGIKIAGVVDIISDN
jgi:FlaA1/EpsC-like NDP-sugar epimerase